MVNKKDEKYQSISSSYVSDYLGKIRCLSTSLLSHSYPRRGAHYTEAFISVNGFLKKNQKSLKPLFLSYIPR